MNLIKSISLSLLFVTCSAIADINSVNEAINISGKTRFTSQRLGRLYIEKCLLKNKGTGISQASTIMDHLYDELSNFKAISSNNNTIINLKDFGTAWSDYKSSLTGSSCGQDDLKRVYGKSETLGNIANTMVSSIQTNLGTGSGAKYVNQAGKQRWMAMRIVKYSFAAQAGIISKKESDNLIDELKKAWIKSQKELRLASGSKPELQNTLDDATSKFNLLTDMLGSNDIQQTAVAVDSLIDTLNTAVKMFEGNDT